ncbi:secretory calcium-binding phosphoprotein 7 [Centroberyx affinis]|uniref:secretory calcium-binding phosphoprotein 7 n=1 Tax=Centroberyx affinis TaxID=166261 RepID=UPI003A5BABFA
MKFFLLAVCILGTAICAPQQMFMEFDFHHAPAQAVQAAPAGAPVGSLEVLLPVDAQRQPAGGPIRGFIKQEIPQPNGLESKEVLYAFGFNEPAPAAPAAPVAPVVPVVPVAPVAPVVPIVAVAPAPKGDDDDEEDD